MCDEVAGSTVLCIFMHAFGQSESDTLSNWATGAQPYYISTEVQENQGVRVVLFVVFFCGISAKKSVFPLHNPVLSQPCHKASPQHLDFTDFVGH